MDPISSKTTGEGDALEFDLEGRGLRVIKVGATTGRTYGRVNGLYNIKLDQVGPYPIELHGVLHIETEDNKDDRFCDEGDSGSVIWERDQSPHRAIGMLISDVFMHAGFAVPIRRVLDAIEGEIVSDESKPRRR